MRNRRENQTAQQREVRNQRVRTNASTVDLNRAAFHYECTIDDISHTSFQIGTKEVGCNHCGALKFAAETPGRC